MKLNNKFQSSKRYFVKNKVKLENKREIVREYIRKNPKCTYKEIRRDTKIKVERIYQNLKAAYKDANVILSKNLTKRNIDEQKQDIISFIKSNPGCTTIDIRDEIGVNITRIFGSIVNAYREAGVSYPKKEITSGVRNPYVVKRCKDFEKRIIKLLSKLGKVEPKIRTSAGIIDCLFWYKGEPFVVEVKDYRGKNNITMHEIKQLIRYMESLDYNQGFIICPKESFPKRKNSRNIYKDNRTIRIVSEEDLRGCSINHLA